MPRTYSVVAAPVSAVPSQLAAEWRDLATCASESNAFAEEWFVDAALRHLRGTDPVRLATVRDNAGLLVGVMPLAIVPQHGRLPVAHVGNWVHLQCYCGVPLVRSGDETAFWTALLAHLDASDWASSFLALRLVYADGPVMRGLRQAAWQSRRMLDVVQQYDRATLASEADAETYLETTVRPKKRKELRRQAKRLAELGAVTFEQLPPDGPIDEWCDQYLALEAAGWKGKGGTALGGDVNLAAFFRKSMASAHALGRLDFLRLLLDGRPIAMLVNLRAAPTVWSYKITYDEELSRYSPGVLIELEAMPLLLGDPEIAWSDSCAKPDHPMINSLWGERQSVVHVMVSLRGALRHLTYLGCRSVDAVGAMIRQNDTQGDANDQD
jgi:CelD/BcsL family acetyltransferase involved in cellulose biosynthesis